MLTICKSRNTLYEDYKTQIPRRNTVDFVKFSMFICINILRMISINRHLFKSSHHAFFFLKIVFWKDEGDTKKKSEICTKRFLIKLWNCFLNIIMKYLIQSLIFCFPFILGFLDSSTDDKDILPGSKMELPFWLAYALCSQKRRIVSVELPKAYRESYREVMKADANVVNLYKLGPYYYNFGMKLQCFSFPEIDDVSKCLLSVSNKIDHF